MQLREACFLLAIQLLENKKRDIIYRPLAKLFQHFYRITIRVVDGNFQRHLTGQGVCGAAEAWVVGADRHLNHV
jgi:hypothetical protein